MSIIVLSYFTLLPGLLKILMVTPVMVGQPQDISALRFRPISLLVLLELVWQFLFFIMVDDSLFSWSHRLLHLRRNDSLRVEEGSYTDGGGDPSWKCGKVVAIQLAIIKGAERW